MKIRFTRTYEVDVDAEIIERALAERIDEWDYDDDTPDEERSMGTQDVLWWLEREGHLDTCHPVPEHDAEICEGVFEKDFYTLAELRNELSIPD